MAEKIQPTACEIDLEIVLNNLSTINYTPSFLELFNKIWIIYFSLFIPLYFIGKCIMAAVFKFKLFPARERLRIGDYVLDTTTT